MTPEEYRALFAKARKDIANISLQSQIRVDLAYRRATEDVAKALRATLEKELSLITVNAQADLLAQLAERSTKLADDVAEILSEAARRSAKIAAAPDAKYLTEVLTEIYGTGAGAQIAGGIYAKINDDAIRDVASRIYSDGYSLSSRVWNLKDDYETTIKDIITTGLAQGRDPVKLVKDIQVYVANGKIALAERWGALERGTDEWKARIKGRIDYRAMRLIRSEIQATVQSLAVQSAHANPATTGEFEWILGPGLDHCDECSDYASRRFTEETIPEYPHPNCGCQIRPVLRDSEQFVGDLEQWINGTVTDENRYIDDWAQEFIFAA